jgi:hypothetical protein
MGVGRCGSTYVMNQLNTNKQINIFGEDMGSTLSLLHSLFCLKQFSQHISKHPKIKECIKHVNQEILLTQINKNSIYVGNEMFHDYNFHINVESLLANHLTSCYNHQITGFKEIRWDLFDSLEFLTVVSNYYKKIKYIYLTRSDEEVVESSKKAWTCFDEQETRRRIKCKKEKINNFLNKQSKEQILIGDVTKNPSFINRVFDFVNS